MPADQKSVSAPEGRPADPKAARPAGRPRSRPPFFAIFLLSGFLLLALSFVTFRQIRAGEANRLRLLAGFADQVEATVPELATRFLNVVEQSKNGGGQSADGGDPGEVDCDVVADRLEAVPNVSLVDRASEVDDEDEKKIGFEVTPKGDQIYLTLRTQVSRRIHADCYSDTPESLAVEEASEEGETAISEEEAAGETGDAEEAGDAESDEVLVRFVGRLDLGETIDPIVIPDVFDLILLARQDDHDVLFQHGEPELKMGLVSGAWEVRGGGLLSGLTDLVTESGDGDPSGGGTRVVETEIAGKDYRVFLQPVTLHFRDPEGNPLVTRRWVASGIISWERLLASSFSTSPVLLFLMVALFPILLAAWPFLKLWLISRKQRFTRFDVAALLFSCVLALALATFLLLDAAFMTRVQRTVDDQLRGLATALTDALRQEIGDVACQLDAARTKIEPASDLTELRIDRPFGSWDEIHEKLPSGWREGGETSAEPLRYPLLHSIFWADDEGQQVYKVPFDTDSLLRNRIADRGYYRCAVSRGALELRQAAICPSAPDSDDEAEENDEAEGETRETRVEVCIESIRSKTTAEDVVAFAVPLQPRVPTETSEATGEEGGDGASDGGEDLRAIVLVTRLASLGQALLPLGTSFAVVDADGRVQFHSDRRRSASEDFTKAAGGDLLLAAMIAERRTGSISINYWGQRYRAFVRPIEGSPWSIVTLRSARGLRARNFELLFDFLNPFLPYLLLTCLVLFVTIRWGRLRLVRYLWPARDYTAIYRAILHAAPWIIGLFSLAWASGLPWAVVVTTLAAPLAALVVAVAAVGGYFEMREDGGGERLATGWPRLWRSFSEIGKADLLRLLAVALALVVALVNRRPIPIVLLAAAAGAWHAGLVLRRSFIDRTTRAPYVAAFATLLFCTAVLPTVGFFRLAESRQTQLLVQDVQIGLAHAEVRHRARRIAERPALAGHLRRDHDAYLDEITTPARAATARTAFDSVLGEGLECPPDAPPPRWPFAAARSESPCRPASHLLAHLLAARPVPLTELAPDPEGTDLSRYGYSGGDWWIAPDTDDERPRLFSALPSPTGDDGALSVRSDRPDDDLLEALDPVRGTAIGCGWLLLFFGTVSFARYVTYRVLLVDLAPNHRQAKLEKILELAAPELRHPKRFLLVYPLPEAVVQMATFGNRAGRFHAFRFASLWSSEDDPKRRERAFMAPLEKEQRMMARRTSERRTLLISDFRPELEDPAVAKAQIDLLERMRKLGGGPGRSILIVTSRQYHRLESPERGAVAAGENGAREARSWWSGYLARFTQRYGRDAGDIEVFKKYLEAKRKDVEARQWKSTVPAWFLAPGTPRKGEAAESATYRTLSASNARRLEELLDVIDHECRWSWRLQRTGLEIVRELESELAEESSDSGGATGHGSTRLPTGAQLVSRIEFAVTPYYQKIWDTCDRSEKLVLHQLAREGVVNPKSFDTALDLLNKGLIVRDVDKPALRLMNRSFRAFVLRTVQRSQLLAWEEEEGFSAWEVWKWVLPLPLLLLGVFLFITQQDAVSNVVGLLIALASLVPTGFNLYQHFQQMMTTREAGGAG